MGSAQGGPRAPASIATPLDDLESQIRTGGGREGRATAGVRHRRRRVRVTVVPSFFAVHSGIPWLVVAVLLLQLGVWYALMTGAESTLFAELFDTAVALMPRWIGGRPFWTAGTRW